MDIFIRYKLGNKISKVWVRLIKPTPICYAISNIFKFRKTCMENAKIDKVTNPGKGSLFLNIQMQNKEQIIKYITW